MKQNDPLEIASQIIEEDNKILKELSNGKGKNTSDNYKVVKNGDKIKIPSECPKCGRKLHHINALDTPCRLYLVACTDNRSLMSNRCRYIDIWKFDK